jgi:hypothetical protein
LRIADCGFKNRKERKSLLTGAGGLPYEARLFFEDVVGASRKSDLKRFFNPKSAIRNPQSREARPFL